MDDDFKGKQNQIVSVQVAEFSVLFVLVWGSFGWLVGFEGHLHTQKTEGKLSLHYSFPKNSLLFLSALSWLHFKDAGKWNRSKTNIASHCFTSKDSITE